MKAILFLLVGGFSTFLLFLGMTYLVTPEPQNFEPNSNTYNYVPFDIDDTPPPIKTRRLPEKVKQLNKPKSERAVISRQQPSKSSLLRERGLEISKSGLSVALNSHENFSPWGKSSANGDGLQPTVRINPRYPVHAARDNVEGFVTLTFDISETGKPVNIQIEEAKPRGYFEKSAKRALKKWKFDPETVKSGVDSQQVTLQFQLENEA